MSHPWYCYLLTSILSIKVPQNPTTSHQSVPLVIMVSMVIMMVIEVITAIETIGYCHNYTMIAIASNCHSMTIKAMMAHVPFVMMPKKTMMLIETMADTNTASQLTLEPCNHGVEGQEYNHNCHGCSLWISTSLAFSQTSNANVSVMQTLVV